MPPVPPLKPLVPTESRLRAATPTLPSIVTDFMSADPTPQLAQARLVLIRGLPGSGKSTLARRLAAEAGFVHLEADQYFERDGAYRFDLARVADAHAWCLRSAYEQLAGGARVVIANTFVSLWELSACLGLAQVLDLPVRIIEARGAWPSVHAVPADVMAQMRERWEALPAHLETIGSVWLS